MAEVSTSSRRTLDLINDDNQEIVLEMDEFYVDVDPRDKDRAVYDAASFMKEVKAPVGPWIRLVEELWRLQKWRLALIICDEGLEALGDTRDKPDQVPLLAMRANYNLALARKAPKTIITRPRSNHGIPLARTSHEDHPESDRPDPNEPPYTKADYWRNAEADIKRAERLQSDNKAMLDVKAALLLASGKLEEASKLFERILDSEPTHLYALMGRARILFLRRSFRPALKAYQTVLAYAPNLLPDPRIGIGLCFWMLGERDTAKAAWERSIAANKNSPSNSAETLLGLLHINIYKDPAHPSGDEGRATAYITGMAYLQTAFKKDNTTSATHGPLVTRYLKSESYENAIKLAERSVQFADAATVLSDAHLNIARVLHVQKDDQAIPEYAAAGRINRDQLTALLAVAQFQTSKGDFPAATDMFETIIRRHPRCIEALVSLATIHTHLAFTHPDAADSKAERTKAKDLYDQALRLFSSGKENQADGETDVKKNLSKSARLSEVARDPELFLEIARLWSEENDVTRSLKAYEESARITTENGNRPSPRVLNNIGALEFHRGHLEAAQDKFEAAATEGAQLLADSEMTEELDAIMTAIGFNLGVVYKASGDNERAKGAFDQIVSRHPEFVDAKAHLALMAIATSDHEDAHNLIKESLASQPDNLEIRALYSYFLIETGQLKIAHDFSTETLRGKSRVDVYAHCAAGYLHYNRARENKIPGKEADLQRTERYCQAAELFSKALKLDPHCVFAAQGLAISIAEGTIGSGVEAGASVPMTEQAVRAKNTRDALTILMKVKESVNNGSVYINIGHSHFMREEWERAIESYETASKRYFHGKNVNCLLYLSRSWFHKSSKDRSFSDLQKALEASKAALALSPRDLAIIFNVAIIQQKEIELLFELPAEKKTTDELKIALLDLTESQEAFERLATDQPEQTPYLREIPRQRHRYGFNLIKRSFEAIEMQQAYEDQESARIAQAKALRDAERQRIADMEERRLADLERQKELLREQRRAMGEETAAWVSAKKWDSEDEEKPKKEAGAGKKRKNKKKEEEEEASASGSDDEKPKKKVKKAAKTLKGKKGKESEGAQAMDLDSDGEEKVGTKRRKGGKVFQSAEFVEDSDSEANDEPRPSKKNGKGSDQEQESAQSEEEEEAVESDAEESESQTPREDAKAEGGSDEAVAGEAMAVDEEDAST